MLKKLIYKEFVLAAHPTAYIFLGLSAMLIIPSYPYYVVFFYTGLAIFFTCLGGRENNDVFYTLTLPVAKRDVVRGRIAYVMLIELLQSLVCLPFALLRQSFDMPGNEVGMDANLALFGLSFVMMGLFNLVFFSKYYRDVTKVGRAFAVGSTVVFLYIIVAEACAHVVPFFRDVLDTPDSQNLAPKLLVLAIGIAIWVVLSLLAEVQGAKSFEAQDL